MTAQPRSVPPEVSFVSNSADETEALGEALGRALLPGCVLALSGELGAGKTCLVRGLARGIESEDPVSSPTYTLAHEYAGRLTLHHLDAWMAEREASFLAAGGEELLLGESAAVIEWAGHVEAWLPRPHLALELAHLDPRRRRVTARLITGEGGSLGPLEGLWAVLVAHSCTIPPRQGNPT
ncbi:tRNA (adenosine(37)-N6)-threonylcarbamoyltransferase complex ATPase subunit type 1 TsaE [Engelhardtia mirabilis]|uniref:tRNA threonylcarbamoyladenosine biosynthesis protein TsaE n=1 Tax=Engelhardtia mirabilis TaxID=2528011 RepID=A0A518BKR6_9BACT|nr:tRNA threonylcarbamoyladenosine biosynthesis protein TsaE [Planctomycetes bacterium Pla133]QDV01893.1 tRNA threonylcarbamoyladenosine biosynthesis protein TsaE [Planctomycetes bacterium Pla86]